jgi:hypothetical protein
MTAQAEHATVEVTVSELQTANEQLRRSNAELRLLLHAVAEGFEALNEWSNGRLHELIRQGAEELAAQIYSILDGNDYQLLDASEAKSR